MLPDAPFHIQANAALVAVAKELEAVQVLLLGSQALQLNLKSVSSCSLSGSFHCLLSHDVVLQYLFEKENKFASFLALLCLGRYHEFLKLVEGYVVDVSWTPSASCRILHIAVDNILVAGEVPFQESESTVFSVNAQPPVNIIKVNFQGIRVAFEMFTEGQREEFLGFFVGDAS